MAEAWPTIPALTARQEDQETLEYKHAAKSFPEAYQEQSHSSCLCSSAESEGAAHSKQWLCQCGAASQVLWCCLPWAKQCGM